MKAVLLFICIVFGLINLTAAQDKEENEEEKPKVSHIKKGEAFVSLAMQGTNKYQIKDSFYKTPGINVSGGYYFLKRMAIRVSVTGQQFQAQETVTPTSKEFNKKNLAVISGQLRYNFWEYPGFMSTFIQTGYGYGQFTNVKSTPVKSWEILTFGESFYFPKAIPANLGFELAVSLEKDNLNKKYAFPFFIGFNYFFCNSN